MDHNSEQPLLAYITCPDETVAKRIAQALVEERIAACVNILPDLQSVYRWQGQVQSDGEWLLMIKTRSEHIATINQRLATLHPDDLPELIAVDIDDGSPAFLDWIIDETR